MKQTLERYIGRTVTIIYADRGSGFSKRRIKIIAVDGRYVKAFCQERRAPRTFLIDSILALDPRNEGMQEKPSFGSAPR